MGSAPPAFPSLDRTAFRLREPRLARGPRLAVETSDGREVLAFDPPADPDDLDAAWLDGLEAGMRAGPRVPPEGLSDDGREHWLDGHAWGARRVGIAEEGGAR